MAEYTGAKCLGCDKEFMEGDDIVVCPDCGTPYHRECYLKEGKCVNIPLHESGKSWKSVHSANKEESIRCPRCGRENPSLSLFCTGCGQSFANSGQEQEEPGVQAEQKDPYNAYGNPFNQQALHVNFTDPLCGMNPEENHDGARLVELADCVGSNTFYFLPMFKMMKDGKRKFTWNFPAFFLGPFYYAYRKMYGAAVITALFSALIGFPSMILQLQSIPQLSQAMQGFIFQFDVHSNAFTVLYYACSILNWALIFAMGSFTNWLYYKHCLAKIKKMKEAGPVTQSQVQKKGGTSIVGPLVLLGLIVVLGIAGSFALVASAGMGLRLSA